MTTYAQETKKELETAGVLLVLKGRRGRKRGGRRNNGQKRKPSSSTTSRTGPGPQQVLKKTRKIITDGTYI